MKTTSIFFSFALAFKTIYSKALNSNNTITSEPLNIPEQLNIQEEDKNKDFIYDFHCSEDSDCENIKNDLNFALEKLSNTFG